jgi:superfamily II DNA or RNA helicase
LSYEVPNKEWCAAFKEERWDGRISLYYRQNQSFPAGLTSRVAALLKEKEIEFKLVDKRQKPIRDYELTCDFGNKALRFYQTEAGNRSAKFQRGIIAAATGAGKTMLACHMLAEMRVRPVVFIVPAIELLRQTRKEFHKYLRCNGEAVEVGAAGDGICDLNPQGINIITYQTALAAFNEIYREGDYKIVSTEGAGERDRRPTDELKTLYLHEKKAYAAACREAELKLAEDKKAVVELEAQLEKALVQENEALRDPSTKKGQIKSLIASRRKIEKQLISHRYKIRVTLSKLVAPRKQAYDKAKNAYKTRLVSLENKAKIRDLIVNCQALIVDEAHVAAVVIEALGEHAENAYYRVGLSATPWREDNQEIRIEGALGKKLFEISASDLIELGYLVPPKIFMIRNDHVEYAESYEEIYSKHVVNCWKRNYRIKMLAEAFKEAGRPVMILVERRAHGELLEQMINDSVFIAGGDKGEDDPTDEERNYRRRMLNKTEKNEMILIATQWANVGVDAPAISVLILAGSGQSSVTTYQQAGRVLRCLGKDIQESIENGKPDAIIIDFMDEQELLHKHSLRRKRVYRRERAWSCQVIN